MPSVLPVPPAAALKGCSTAGQHAANSHRHQVNHSSLWCSCVPPAPRPAALAAAAVGGLADRLSSLTAVPSAARSAAGPAACWERAARPRVRVVASCCCSAARKAGGNRGPYWCSSSAVTGPHLYTYAGSRITIGKCRLGQKQTCACCVSCRRHTYGSDMHAVAVAHGIRYMAHHTAH